MTRLKLVLSKKKMTQKELADLSDIGEYKISLLCSGKADNVQLITCKRICVALNCSLDEVFGDILDK
tara:strand:+ start:143 stop:343 length:201 start_codon:yes stop_codon:yes gene_type:complete